MQKLKDNGDGTYSLANSICYPDGWRIITINGKINDSKLDAEISISPILHDHQGFVFDTIYSEIEIIDGDIHISDEYLFSEYPPEVIKAVNDVLNDFWRCLSQLSQKRSGKN